MAKRIATDEQRDEARKRRAGVASKWAAMSDEERAALCGHRVVQPDGHVLSARNAGLVVMQNGRATMVAGFHDWKRAGRKVKKGEHGMMLFVPMGCNKQDDDSAPKGFTVRYVFDITQTEATNGKDQ